MLIPITVSEMSHFDHKRPLSAYCFVFFPLTLLPSVHQNITADGCMVGLQSC